MELKPRFSNRAIRRLFESHQIDLMRLPGEAVTDPETRLRITQAGHDESEAENVKAACEELTPGEHIDLLTDAIRRDLIPASIREATAKAATPSKSE